MIIVAVLPEAKSPTIQHFLHPPWWRVALVVAGIISIAYIVWEMVLDARLQREMRRREKKNGVKLDLR